jgi:hypothetical protein
MAEFVKKTANNLLRRSCSENAAKTPQKVRRSQRTELGNTAHRNVRGERRANTAECCLVFLIYVPLARTLFD